MHGKLTYIYTGRIYMKCIIPERSIPLHIQRCSRREQEKAKGALLTRARKVPCSVNISGKDYWVTMSTASILFPSRDLARDEPCAFQCISSDDFLAPLLRGSPTGSGPASNSNARGKSEEKGNFVS